MQVPVQVSWLRRNLTLSHLTPTLMDHTIFRPSSISPPPLTQSHPLPHAPHFLRRSAALLLCHHLRQPALPPALRSLAWRLHLPVRPGPVCLKPHSVHYIVHYVVTLSEGVHISECANKCLAYSCNEYNVWFGAHQLEEP